MKEIVIAGSPNVGKSTLFNRLARRDISIVHNRPGVTRDFQEARLVLPTGGSCRLVDTGGYLPQSEVAGHGEAIVKAVVEKGRQQMARADLILYICDGAQGLTVYEEGVINEVRRLNRPILFVINKIDKRLASEQRTEFLKLGGDEVFFISAERKTGIDELLMGITRRIGDVTSSEGTYVEESVAARIAIVGRPNVGKSLFLNRLLNEDRMIVSDIPGTTRDATDTLCRIGKQSFILIDTSGLRRKSRINNEGDTVEQLSVQKAVQAIMRSDVVILMADVVEGLTHQDLELAALISKKLKPCLICGNKWDLIKSEVNASMANAIKDAWKVQLGRLRYAPIHWISALTGYHMKQLPALIGQIMTEAQKRVATGPLNRIFEKIKTMHPAPQHGAHHPTKLYYITQAQTAPPTFCISTNQKVGLKGSHYAHYLENELRRQFGFEGVPIRLIFRSREDM